MRVAMENEAKTLGQCADEAFVVVGVLPPQLVVHMNDSKSDALERREVAQDSEQAHRVRTAGDSHANTVARAQHAITCENPLNLFEQAIL